MNLPKSILIRMQEQMKRSTGTVTFEYSCSEVTNKKHNGWIIFQILAGKHIFVLERTKKFKVNFYYGSPGTGTRIATINLEDMPSFHKAFYCLTWSPENISLSIWPRWIDNPKLISANWTISKKKIQVGETWWIFYIGDEGLDVMNVSIFEWNKKVLSSTAIETWNDTKKALEILWTWISKEGYIHECVVTNLSISIIVTWFESYFKKRFLELEWEWKKPNITSLSNYIFSEKKIYHEWKGIYKSSIINSISILSKAIFNLKNYIFWKKENSYEDLIYLENDSNGKTILEQIVNDRKINFQNYNDVKKAFKKTYWIAIKWVDINSDTVTDLKNFLNYRHKIIHVSPLISPLNEDKLTYEDPIFPNEELKLYWIRIFNEFIQKFHERTLNL